MKKLNLIIRTYKVSNLKLSLFKLPFSIKPEEVDIYIHNDNPDSIDELHNILMSFSDLYPNYNIRIIQEVENQQMFMSYLNSISSIILDNDWTMILDDDDTLIPFDKEIVEFINNTDRGNCIKYRMNKCLLEGLIQYPIELDGYKSAWYKWHRIYPTWALKKVYQNKDDIKDALVKFNGSTKFAMCEDKLMNNLVLLFSGIDTIKYEKELINYSIYPHQVNGYRDYATNNDTSDADRNDKIVGEIIDYLKKLNNR